MSAGKTKVAEVIRMDSSDEEDELLLAKSLKDSHRAGEISRHVRTHKEQTELDLLHKYEGKTAKKVRITEIPKIKPKAAKKARLAESPKIKPPMPLDATEPRLTVELSPADNLMAVDNPSSPNDAIVLCRMAPQAIGATETRLIIYDRFLLEDQLSS